MVTINLEQMNIITEIKRNKNKIKAWKRYIKINSNKEKTLINLY